LLVKIGVTMLSIRAKRIALVFVGAVAVAACGGSSTSTPDSPTTLYKKNASLISNVKHYSGISSVSYVDKSLIEFPSGSFIAGDRVAFDFDVNLDAVDADPANTTSLNSWSTLAGVDFRSAFSNFSLKGLDGNVGSVDLSEIVWAKCPLKVGFSPPRMMMYSSPGSTGGASGIGIGTVYVTFGEAPNASFATEKCQPLPQVAQGISGYWRDALYATEIMNFYDADSPPVEAKGVKFTIAFDSHSKSIGTAPLTASPSLKEIFPLGLDPLITLNSMQSLDGTVYRQVALTQGYARQLLVKPSYQQPVHYILKSITSSQIKDYTPFELTAVASDGGIDAQWKRSVDLSADDEAISVVEVSKDNFANILTSTQVPSVDALESLSLASCDLDPKNTLKAGTEISVRVKALDKNGVPSAYTDAVVVTKEADNLACPTATLSAPVGLVAALDIPEKRYTAEWNAVTDAGDTELTYCIETSNSSFATKSEDQRLCVGNATQSDIDWTGQDELAFRVVAISANGVVSPPSDTVFIKLPDPKSATGAVVALVQDGLNVSWIETPQAKGLSNVSHLVKWGLLKNDSREAELGGLVLGSATSYVIPRADWESVALPGSKIWVDVSSCTEVACAKPVSATFALPETAANNLPTDVTVTTSTSVLVLPTVPSLPSTTIAPANVMEREVMMINPMYSVSRFCSGTGEARQCSAWTVPSFG